MGIVEMMNSSSNPESNRPIAHGIILAKVTDINDPNKKGRIKCSFITDDSDAGETGWIYYITLFGGNNNGMCFHPNVGDIVALGFQNGNIETPIALGSVWIADNNCPIELKDGKNDEYKIITPNKSCIDLYDESGKEKITVSTPKGRTLLLDDENQIIKLSDEKNTVVLNQKNGTVEITAEKKLLIKVGSAITVSCDGTSGELKIDAKKAVDISTAQFKVNASGTAEVSGNGSAEIKSSGMLTLKGSMTKIN